MLASPPATNRGRVPPSQEMVEEYLGPGELLPHRRQEGPPAAAGSDDEAVDPGAQLVENLVARHSQQRCQRREHRHFDTQPAVVHRTQAGQPRVAEGGRPGVAGGAVSHRVDTLADSLANLLLALPR